MISNPEGRPSPAAGVARLARAAVLGVTSLLLATAAHLVGGGRLPSAGVLTVVGLLLALVAVTVTARRCRTGLLLVLLAGQQLALHLVFSAAASVGVHCTLTESAMPHGAAVGHVLTACSASPSMAGPAMIGPGWAMWAGHLTATVMTAVLLARGERWLWRAADRIVTAATAAPGRSRAARRHGHRCTEPSSVVRARAYAPAAPRGPPALVAS